MISLPITRVALAIATGILTASAAHAGHVYAGLIDSNSSGTLDANDALAFYNGNTGASILQAPLGPFTMTIPSIPNTGQEGLFLNSSISFTALAKGTNGAVLDGGSPVNVSPFAATAGSLIRLQIYNVTGPAGAKFSFWENGATTATQTFIVGTTLAGSLGTFDLTDTSANTTVGGVANGSNPPLDPFGHLHGRTLTADLPGTYTVSYVLSDAMNARQASTPFTVTYTTVPEPAAVALLGGAGLLVGILRRRRTVR